MEPEEQQEHTPWTQYLPGFGHSLTRVLRDVGLQKTELAHRMGCHKSQISKWCNHHNVPDRTSLKRILDQLPKPYHREIQATWEWEQLPLTHHAIDQLSERALAAEQQARILKRALELVIETTVRLEDEVDALRQQVIERLFPRARDHPGGEALATVLELLRAPHQSHHHLRPGQEWIVQTKAFAKRENAGLIDAALGPRTKSPKLQKGGAKT